VQLGAAAARRVPPGVDAGRVFLGQDEDPVTRPEVEVAGRDGEAITGRRYVSDRLSRGANEAAEQLPRPLGIVEPVPLADRPRPATLLHRRLAGRTHGTQLRAEVRGVEVRDLAGHVERVPVRTDTWAERRRRSLLVGHPVHLPGVRAGFAIEFDDLGGGC
jgi:hypothetical protein